MSETERNTVLHLVKLIMSSKSVEEQQKEALQCLKSNPEVLLSLLKRSCNQDDNGRTFKTPKNTDSRRISSLKSLPNVTDAMDSKDDVQQIHRVRLPSNSDLSHDQHVDQSQQTVSIQTTSSEISPSDEVSLENTTRKRRSKYSHIEGDLSHIQRDPKCKFVSQNISKRKCSRRKKKDKESEKEKGPLKCDEQHNIHLVRRLIEMLKYPKSRQHQECIVALLRTDDNLRRLFLEEKAKMGKQVVQVFRRSTSINVSQGLPAVDAHQNPPTTAESSYFMPEEVLESSLNSPHNISSGIMQAEDEFSSSDALIYAILNTLKSNDVETLQDHQRPMNTDEVSMHIPFTGFHVQGSRSITNMQNDLNETNKALYIQLRESGQLSTVMSPDSGIKSCGGGHKLQSVDLAVGKNVIENGRIFNMQTFENHLQYQSQ